MKVLVTGAGGFVGRAIWLRLNALHGTTAVGSTRSECGLFTEAGLPSVTVSELSSTTDWTMALVGVSVVAHAAARVHVMKDADADPLAAFRRVNVNGTLKLARQAAEMGVQRFVFVSSIKVNGEFTQPGQAFTADDVPAPLDAYGISKMEAERGLQEIAAKTGMQLVIIRPPLVHGPSAKGNFATLQWFLQRGVPLPLGAINNRRSLVALDNLVDLIVTCLKHRSAAGHTFLVSDGEDLSTTDLLRHMGQAMGRPARLIAVPAAWLEYAARLLGKQEVARRICGSLQVDIEKTRRVLGWRPPLTLDEGLKMAAGNRVIQ